MHFRAFQPQRRPLININTEGRLSLCSVCREFIVPATRQPLCKYWRTVDFMGGLWFRERGWKGGSLLVYTFNVVPGEKFPSLPSFFSLLNETKLETNLSISSHFSHSKIFKRLFSWCIYREIIFSFCIQFVTHLTWWKISCPSLHFFFDQKNVEFFFVKQNWKQIYQFLHIFLTQKFLFPSLSKIFNRLLSWCIYREIIFSFCIQFLSLHV